MTLQQLIDGQRLGWFSVRLLLVSFLIMCSDGYDLQAAAFAAPGLVHDWGIPRQDLPQLFSASLLGILLGSPIMGWIGDRFGRKPAILLCCAMNAGLALGCAMATSFSALVIMRILTGAAIGGLMPNANAVNAELAPRSRRGLFIALMFIGVSVGAAAPGLLISAFPALRDWRHLFLGGAVAPAIGGLLALAFLPESPTMLVAKGQSERLARTLRQVRPDLTDLPTTFETPAEPPAAPGPQALFAGGLKITTPMLWLINVLVFIASYMLTSWTPLLMQSSGLSPEDAAGATSALHLGGGLGGLTTALILDRFGWSGAGLMLAAGVCAAVMVGVAHVPVQGLMFIVGFCGFGILGAQFALNAASSMIYPARIRSLGAGAASAIGRVGSIIGPFVGGALVATGATGRTLFLATIGPVGMAVLLLSFLAARDGFFRPLSAPSDGT